MPAITYTIIGTTTNNITGIREYVGPAGDDDGIMPSLTGVTPVNNGGNRGGNRDNTAESSDLPPTWVMYPQSWDSLSCKAGQILQ